jgi:valacyclovir hydrolase
MWRVKMAWFNHVNGRIWYDETGSGEALLFLPGLTESGDDFREMIDKLAPHYRVIAVDLPGSGHSEPQPRHYTAAYYHEDAEAIAALTTHLGIGSYHIAGFSDGGEVALILAVQQPGAVLSAFIWGAAGGLDPNTIGPMIQVFHDIVDNPPEFMQGFSEHLKARYGEANARAMTQSAADAFKAIAENGGDVGGSRAGDIRCPVLILAGENDPFAPASLVRPLAERIPRAELIEVPGVGHSLHEEQPEWFMQTLLDWLTKQSLSQP